MKKYLDTWIDANHTTDWSIENLGRVSLDIAFQKDNTYMCQFRNPTRSAEPRYQQLRHCS